MLADHGRQVQLERKSPGRTRQPGRRNEARSYRRRNYVWFIRGRPRGDNWKSHQPLAGGPALANRNCSSKNGQTMDERPGIYALIMHLPVQRRLDVGTLGEHACAPGWYVYVGSAHGPGGLKRCINRHRARHRRQLQHVDRLTAVADIREIWFSHAEASCEHHLLNTLASLSGAEFPIPGFGSQQCTVRCKARLIHFQEHPLVAVFRASLSKRHPKHPPIYVEFLKPSAQRAASGDVMEAYLRGRRYLEARRAAIPAPTGPLARFARGQVGWQLIHQLAEATGIDVDSLKKDAEFAEAVEIVVAECGEMAAKVFFNDAKPQQRSAIMKIRRKSCERQKYRIECVLAGTKSSVAPQSEDRVPDTMTFRKVISRLERARGDVEAGLQLLEPAPQCVDQDQALLHKCRRPDHSGSSAPPSPQLCASD